MDPAGSPYEPPKSPVGHDCQEVSEIIPAGKWLRLFNCVIDYMAYLALSAVLGVLLALFGGAEGVRYVQSLPDYVLGVSILLTYYVTLEAFTGRTVGKWVTGTKVVNEDGLKASFGQILGRSFARFIPFEAFSFLGEQARGWHDRLPKTYVVKVR